MEGFFQDPAILHHWQRLGGIQTLASYGVELRNEPRPPAICIAAFSTPFRVLTNCSCSACAISPVAAISCSFTPAFVPTSRSTQDPDDLIGSVISSWNSRETTDVPWCTAYTGAAPGYQSQPNQHRYWCVENGNINLHRDRRFDDSFLVTLHASNC